MDYGMGGLFEMAIVGMAALIAAILLTIASIFIGVQMWWIFPATFVVWMPLKLFVFKD